MKNQHGIFVYPKGGFNESKALLSIATFINKTKFVSMPSSLDFEDMRNKLKETINSCSDNTLIHVNINSSMGLHLIEPLNLYIINRIEGIIFDIRKRTNDNLHILITIDGIENYRRVHMNYLKLIESVYLYIIPENSIPPLAEMKATQLVSNLGYSTSQFIPAINETCKLLMKFLKNHLTIVQSKWRYFSFIESIFNFNSLLERLIEKKEENIRKILSALSLLKLDASIQNEILKTVNE